MTGAVPVALLLLLCGEEPEWAADGTEETTLKTLLNEGTPDALRYDDAQDPEAFRKQRDLQRRIQERGAERDQQREEGANAAREERAEREETRRVIQQGMADLQAQLQRQAAERQAVLDQVQAQLQAQKQAKEQEAQSARSRDAARREDERRRQAAAEATRREDERRHQVATEERRRAAEKDRARQAQADARSCVGHVFPTKPPPPTIFWTAATQIFNESIGRVDACWAGVGRRDTNFSCSRQVMREDGARWRRAHDEVRRFTHWAERLPYELRQRCGYAFPPDWQIEFWCENLSRDCIKELRDWVPVFDRWANAEPCLWYGEHQLKGVTDCRARVAACERQHGARIEGADPCAGL